MDMVFKRFIRVKILNRNGMSVGQFALGVELGTHYFAERSNSRGVAESITDLHGSTFNLENGIIRETKLDTASIFEEKVEGDLTGKKFAMPALKEGSIFDVCYTERSIFDDQLKSWNFQSEFPCLWSDYQVRIPAAYHYRMKLQGDPHFDINTTNSVEEKFKIEFGGEHGTTVGDVHMSGNSTQIRWVKKNEKAFRREPYVNNVRNYIDRVTFQLEYFQWNDREDKTNDYSTWKEASKTYFKNSGLGEDLEKMNFWMDKDIENSIKKSHDTEQIIQGIYFLHPKEFYLYQS